MNYLLLISLIILTTNLNGRVEEYVSSIQYSIDSGEYKEALNSFDKALNDYDASASLYFLGAQVAMKLDDLDQANKHYVKAIELDPNNEEFRIAQEDLANLKNALTSTRKIYDSGMIDDAIADYEKLIDKYPKHAIVFYNLGLIYRANEEYDLAVQNYQSAQYLNPFEEKYSKAVKAISQMMAKEGDMEFRRQEFDIAILNYHKAISYDPKYTTAMFKLARTYYKLKDYESARIYLKKGLSINPKQEQFEKMLGDIYRKTENFEKALEHYKKAIKINANYYKAYYSLGSLHLSEGRLNEAKESLSSAILLEPTYSKAYGSLGLVEQELGNINVAIQNYTKALEFDRQAYDIHYRLSSAYNINKQFIDAKESAKKSLNIKRNYAPAYFELGFAEKSLGNRVAAKDAFEKAKKDRNWRKSCQYELDLLSKGL